MKTVVRTKSKSGEYRDLLKQGEIPRWWSEYRSCFRREDPAVAVRREAGLVWALLAGIPSQYRDTSGRIILYSVALEARDDDSSGIERIRQCASAWVADMQSIVFTENGSFESLGTSRLGSMLDLVFPDELMNQHENELKSPDWEARLPLLWSQFTTGSPPARVSPREGLLVWSPENVDVFGTLIDELIRGDKEGDAVFCNLADARDFQQPEISQHRLVGVLVRPDRAASPPPDRPESRGTGATLSTLVGSVVESFKSALPQDRASGPAAPAGDRPSLDPGDLQAGSVEGRLEEKPKASVEPETGLSGRKGTSIRGHAEPELPSTGVSQSKSSSGEAPAPAAEANAHHSERTRPSKPGVRLMWCIALVVAIGALMLLRRMLGQL